MIRSTHTYAVLDVSQATYREVREKLGAAGYAHAFHQGSDGEVIDMHGIAVRQASSTAAVDPNMVGMPDDELQAIEARATAATELLLLMGYSHIPADVSALVAEVRRLSAEVHRLTTCDCGRDLSEGRCNVCDNDE